MYLKLSQNLQKVTCAGVSFLTTQALNQQLHRKRDTKILFFCGLHFEILSIEDFPTIWQEREYIYVVYLLPETSKGAYKLVFLEFGLSNNMYGNCTWLPIDYSNFFA